MALFRKRPPRVAASRVVSFDPAAGVPAARAAYDALARGDWRAVEDAHGASHDWETLGAISDAVAELDPFDDWVASAPTSGLAHSIRGAQLTHLAWQVRGSSRAVSVKAEAWPDFFALLEVAEQSLRRATELSPEDPLPWYRLIWSGTGLNVSIEDRLARFAAVRERAPEYAFGWLAIVGTVAEKWGGSHTLMFEVARDGDRALPPGSNGRIGVAQAHYERWLYYVKFDEDADSARNYFKRPDVVAEIGAAASNSVLSPAHHATASTRLTQSWFAYTLTMTGDADTSARIRAAHLYHALGAEGIPKSPWEGRYGDAAAASYVRLRSLCYRAAGFPDLTGRTSQGQSV